MSRFGSTIKSLEDKLKKHRRLAQQLEAENAQLQQQEQSLVVTLGSLQVSMSALMSGNPRLPSPHNSSEAIDCVPEGSTNSERQPTASTSTSSMQHSQLASDGAVDSCPHCSIEDVLPRVTSEDATACQMGLQQRLDALEQLLQGGNQQVNAAPIMNTSMTLQALAAAPERVAAYLVLSPEQRLQWLAGAVKRMALMLPKYESMPHCMQELDAVVDEVMARCMTYTWMDNQDCIIVDISMINMDTGRVEEAYPPGLWHHVVQRMELNPQQRASLSALWSRTKAIRAPLMEQHEALVAELEGLQQQQQAQQQLFAQQAQQLPIKQACEALGKHRHGTATTQQQQQQQHQGCQPQDKPSDPCMQHQPVALPAQTPPSDEGPGPSSSQQEGQQQQPPRCSSLLPDSLLDQDPAAEQLLAMPCATQRRIEARLSMLREQLALNEKLLTTLLWDMTTKKQIAALVVASWPFMPDSHAICEAFDELGW